MTFIKAKHTSIIIPNYNLGDNLTLEHSLSVWNDSYHKYDEKGFFYNKDTKELLLPRGLDLGYLEKIFNLNVDIDFKPDPYEIVSYRLKVEPRDDIQRKSICFLIGEDEFSYTKKYSQLALNLQTGEGKSFCVIAALSFMRTKAIIFTHVNALKKQWIKEIKKFTDVTDSFICNISGGSIIKKILKSNKLPYKIYLVNHRTINNYGETHGWDKVTELFQKIKVGVKVYDEAHFEFDNIIKTDLHTNTKKTIYLTANFERSDFKENKLFNLCFKNIAKYGVETRHEKRKHIVYLGLLFNSKPDLINQASIKKRHGFDKNIYIDYQIKKGKIFDVLYYIIFYFHDKEGRMLILSSKIESTEIIAKYLKEEFPEKTVGVYNSTISDEDKVKALHCDIISSTPKSLGTGLDIPDLRFIIMTEPYSSSITANQTSGRLRELSPDLYGFYIELVDIGFNKVLSLYKNRLKVFKNKCVKLIQLRYDK